MTTIKPNGKTIIIMEGNKVTYKTDKKKYKYLWKYGYDKIKI